jgi:hypothetical protein
MQLRGYVPEDIVAACSWMVRRELIEADHMNRSGVSGHDSVKVTASGFIHLGVLCERIEYLYGVLTVTPIFDSTVGNRIADYLNASRNSCYLSYRYSRLQAAYPEFGSERTGATFVLHQIEGAIQHFKNPSRPVGMTLVSQTCSMNSRLKQLECHKEKKDLPKLYVIALVRLRKILASYQAPPCKSAFAQTVNRTKMFHVKHLCPIGAENLTKWR